MAEEFTRGQTVYDRSGLKYQFEEALPDGRALVRQIFQADSYDGAEDWPAETPIIAYVGGLASKPPVEAVDKEVQQAAAELARLREQIREAVNEIAEQERDAKRRLEALKQHPKLARIEDFLAGRLTHFAVLRSPDYAPAVSIETFEEFARGDEDGRQAKDLKLISLFGRSDGNLEWRRNQYYDGSGSWTQCQPCASFDEAKAVATDWLSSIFAGYQADRQRAWTLESAVKSAEKLGLDVPADIRADLLAYRRRNAEQQLAKAEEDLANRRAALQAIEQERVPA